MIFVCPDNRDEPVLCRYEPGRDTQPVYLSTQRTEWWPPAVGMAGNLAVFVNSDNDLCMIRTDGEYEECIGYPGMIYSTAVSRGGNRFAFVMLDPESGEADNRIEVTDIATGQDATYFLEAPTNTEGATLDVVLMADALDFSRDGRLLVYDTANSALPNNDVWSLQPDGAGGLWAGTSRGLARLGANGAWTMYNESNSGLPYNSVRSLLSDDAGGLWIGTDGGLAHLTFVPKTAFAHELREELVGNAPIPSQTMYRNGEILKVNLPLKPEDRDQYVGLGLPDGTILTLDTLNRFAPFNGARLPRWQGGDTALYLPLPEWLPRGQYQLYLLRVPSGIEPLANPTAWELGASEFKVQ